MQLTTCLGFTCQHRLGVLPRSLHANRTPLPATLDLSKKTPRVSSPEITTGQALAYVYFEDEPGRRAAALFGLFAQDDAGMRVHVMYLMTYRTSHRLIDVVVFRGIFGNKALNAVSAVWAPVHKERHAGIAQRRGAGGRDLNRVVKARPGPPAPMRSRVPPIVASRLSALISIKAAHPRRRPAHHRQAARVVDLPPEPNPARAVLLRKWTGNDAPNPLTQVSCPRSPARLPLAGLSLAADPLQGV